MSGAKEVRSKIASVKSTQKITRAMELVAASKMRKAQDRMRASKPYAAKMRQAVSHLASANPEYKHPFLFERPVKRVGFLVISSDRGLCGGLNINLFKKVIHAAKNYADQNIEVDFCLVGNKAASFFKSVGGSVLALTSGIGDAPTLEQMLGSVKVMLTAYEEGKIDRLYVAYNEFVNTMTQEPTVHQVLPLQQAEQATEQKHSWDYIYEPDAKQLLDLLLKRFVESQVYQGVVENIACEQAARMVAMKAATDNAGELISELALVYNKARQSAITQELSEIVSGASAV